MAIVEVKVPQLSESVAEATLLQWKKKVGDAVAVDEILIDVETDKVVLEVPAPSAGVIIEIVEPDGSTVAAEQLIARIDTEAVAGATAAPVAPVVTAMAAAAAPAAVHHPSTHRRNQQGARGLEPRASLARVRLYHRSSPRSLSPV